MDAGNIIGRHVDFEIIRRFQQCDPRYCTKKFEKLEKRFTTPDIRTIAKPKTVRKVETKTFIALHGNE
jgi:SET domain-containing protein